MESKKNNEEVDEDSKNNEIHLVEDKESVPSENFIDDLEDQIEEDDDEEGDKLKVQNLDFILDIPLKLTVELGRTKVIVKDLLQLGQGSVIELDKLAGEPLEILVNGKLIAKGEVVVVNEKFGIRLTDIISPVERIETLK